jgi:hypothetical protein
MAAYSTRLGVFVWLRQNEIAKTAHATEGAEQLLDAKEIAPGVQYSFLLPP